MEGGGHRRSKSASTIEGIPPSQKFKSSNTLSTDNTLYGNGRSRAEKFMVERGQCSSARNNESPIAKYLAEKMFKEAEPKNSARSMSKLLRLERLNSLWNIKQKTKVTNDHRPNNVSKDDDQDRQPRGCLLYSRKTTANKQQLRDDPVTSNFLNHRRSSEWSASEVGLIRQKIDTKRLSFGELIDSKSEDCMQKDRLMNSYENHQASTSSSFQERTDGLLLEPHNRFAGYVPPRISNAQAKDKKKKKVVARPFVFPSSGIRSIPAIEEICSSSYHSHGNIPNSRKMRESISLYDAHRSNHVHDSYMIVPSSSVDGNERGRRPSLGPVIRDGNNRVLETLKITRTYRDAEQDNDRSVLREVIAITEGETSHSFNYRGRERLDGQVGTETRSSILGSPSTSRCVHRSYPYSDLFSRHRLPNVSQGSRSRARTPLPFPAIRIREWVSRLQATFEMPMEQNVDFSERQLGSPIAGRDNDTGFSVCDIMVDALHPSNFSESSDEDDPTDIRPQGIRYRQRDEDYDNRISDLDSPCAIDASSCSENFERFCIELNELRTKLRLPLVANSFSSEERWEDSYILDVLFESCFQHFGFDMFTLMWSYPDQPLDPSLFENLEKKHDQISPELRPERLLLFGRISKAISDIFLERMDLVPFLRPKSAQAKSVVEKLMNQESTNLQIKERILLREMQVQWDDNIKEIMSMGDEIEESLLDEIILDFVCDLSGFVDVVYSIG